MEERLQDEIHDMSEKIYALQAKTEHLTNGQRYAAINEIEKSIAPLRNDLHHLERKIYNQQHNAEEITKDIDRILQQITKLENIKSDLVQKINTETEHTRKFYHDEQMNFLKEEISPLRADITNNKEDIREIKELLHSLDKKIIKSDKDRELKETKRFDELNKKIITLEKERELKSQERFDVLDKKIIEIEKKREIEDAERFDRFKIVITAVVATIGGLSALSLYFEPAIRTFIHVFLGL